MAVLTEEQSMLRDAARTWTREKSPVSAFRKVRDSGAPLGYTGAYIHDTVTGSLRHNAPGGNVQAHVLPSAAKSASSTATFTSTGGTGTITGASTTLTLAAYSEVNGVETALTVTAAQAIPATAGGPTTTRFSTPSPWSGRDRTGDAGTRGSRSRRTSPDGRRCASGPVSSQATMRSADWSSTAWS